VPNRSIRAIDFRARPAIPEFLAHLDWRLSSQVQVQTSPVAMAKGRALAPAEMIAAMDDAGIEIAVFTSRDWWGEDPRWPLTNEAVAAVGREYPDRFVSFGAMDPRRLDARERIVKAVRELGLRGICIDPFSLEVGASDERFEIVYSTCAELGIPVNITLGALPGIPALMACSHPSHIDAVARSHPDLKIVCSHSCWPYTSEMLGVAFRHDNVWLENSFYHFAPGVSQLIVEAANSWLTERIIYASAFPSAPLKETLVRYAELPFSDRAREHVLYRNALDLLGR
jgi:predicted TIM-barrel fold metal-dependent hydrolase